MLWVHAIPPEPTGKNQTDKVPKPYVLEHSLKTVERGFHQQAAGTEVSEAQDSLWQSWGTRNMHLKELPGMLARTRGLRDCPGQGNPGTHVQGPVLPLEVVGVEGA